MDTEEKEKNRSMSFTLIIVVIILGATLFKQFDMNNLRFEKPWLAGVYLVVFLTSVYLLIRNLRTK